jgi:hypothetical protein
MITKHDKLRLLCHFQHWLGTHYNNLPTDSGNMTERSRKFLKENEQAFSLFDVVGQSEQLPKHCPEIIDMNKGCPKGINCKYPKCYGV